MNVGKKYEGDYQHTMKPSNVRIGKGGEHSSKIIFN
jgi:hypothetical protein